MTSSVLLCKNSQSVIDQLKIIIEPRSGEVINLIGRWHEGNELHNITLLVIFYFYSNYDQTSGIIWWKKVHNAILQLQVAVLLSANNTPLVSVDF